MGRNRILQLAIVQILTLVVYWLILAVSVQSVEPKLCGGKPLAGGGTLSRHISSRSTPPVGRQLLALVDGETSSYSILFGVLRDRGYTVTVRTPKDRSLTLWNEAGTHYLYDAVLLLAPSIKGFGRDGTANALLDFVDANRTLIMTASPNAGALFRSLAEGIGLELDEAGTVLLDHVRAAHRSGAGQATEGSRIFLVDPKPCPSLDLGATLPYWEKEMPQRPLLFANATGSLVAPKQDLLRPVLCAPATSYSYEDGQVVETDEDAAPFTIGTEAVLVAALHGRYGGRVLYIASTEALQDRLMSGEHGNRVYFEDLFTWALGERGILRITRAEHRHVPQGNERPRSTPYRVGDRLRFELCVEEWDGRQSQQRWRPWLGGNEPQLEWVMLDPYVRTSLRATNDQGCYATEFDTPSKHGLFKFRIEHFRDGYTPLLLSQVVPIRPYWHNEYPRMLVRAYPYYAALFSTMMVFWIMAYAVLWKGLVSSKRLGIQTTSRSPHATVSSKDAAASSTEDSDADHQKQE